MIGSVIESLIAALVAAIVSAAPTPVPDRIDVAPPVTEPAPAVWFDPTVGVYVDATPWEPDIGTHPSGEHYGDVCVPDPRFPGFGTTKVGAMPCTP